MMWPWISTSSTKPCLAGVDAVMDFLPGANGRWAPGVRRSTPPARASLLYHPARRGAERWCGGRGRFGPTDGGVSEARGALVQRNEHAFRKKCMRKRPPRLNIEGPSRYSECPTMVDGQIRLVLRHLRKMVSA